MQLTPAERVQAAFKMAEELAGASSMEALYAGVLRAGPYLLGAASGVIGERAEDGLSVVYSEPLGLNGTKLTCEDECSYGRGVHRLGSVRLDHSPVGEGIALVADGLVAVWMGQAFTPDDVQVIENFLPLVERSLQQVATASRRRRRVEKRLQGSEAMAVAVVESAADPVWVLDRTLHLVAFNRACADLMCANFDLQPAIGGTLQGLPEPHRTRHRRLYERVLRKGTSMRIDWSTPDRSRVFDVQIHPVLSEDQSQGVAVYCRDVTDTRRQASLLVRAKDQAERANQAKSDFLAQMSHEIRTPLNAILGLSDLVVDGDLKGPELELVQKIRRNSRALLHLVSGVLDFSGIEAGRLELVSRPMDVCSTVGDVVEFLRYRAENRGLELELTVAPKFPDRVLGDPGRLRQIAVNLVDNAIKYTDFGKVSVFLEVEGTSYVLRVQDTGVGISTHNIESIFDRFQRVDAASRAAAGAGLGLAITRALVDRMKGEIEVASTEGEGTVFTVRLPLEVVRSNALVKGAFTGTLKRRLTILVVDDNEDNRMITQALLEQLGHRVRSACTGEQAIELATDDAFDVVLMDVHMPGIGGIEAARRIRTASEVAILALTAHATKEVQARCEQAGMNGYLTKPVPIATLEEEILRVAPAPRVFVVDDSGESRLLLRIWLTRAGAEVVLAGSVAEALEVAEAEEPFDVLILDHELPDGTGPALAVTLRERGSDAPVIALTGHEEGRYRRMWDAIGPRFMVKPVTAAQVLSMVTELLET